MMNRRGFTLLELLIAAMIIGVLSIFATQAFRNTASDIRVEDAKARAQVVAAALRRFTLDHPNATLAQTETMGTVSAPSTCSSTTISLQNLINCGYLEYRQYATEVRNGNSYKTHFTMTLENDTNGVVVCVQRAQAQGKITDSKKYCTGNAEVWRELSN